MLSEVLLLNCLAGSVGRGSGTAVSLVVSSVDWAVLTINIICLAAIHNG